MAKNENEEVSSPSSGEAEEVEEKKKDKKKEKKKHKDKKKDKKHKSKKRKRGEESDSDDRKKRKEEKKMVKKAKEYLKKQEEDSEPPRRPIPEKLTSADYYRRSTEFRVWLKFHKKVNFEALNREEAQDQFDSFVSKWNKGKLEDMYYDGIPAHIQQQCHKTEHKWGFANKMSEETEHESGFANKMSEEDKFMLERTADRITSATSARPPGSTTASISSHRPAAANNGGGGAASESQYEKELRLEKERASKKGLQKAIKEKEKINHEEMFPKATGREAKIEARKAKSGSIHGAARAREESRDGLDVSEATLMGGGDDDLRRRIEMSKERSARKANDKERRVEELKQKEQETMAKFMADMGLKPGDRITIPKRAP